MITQIINLEFSSSLGRRLLHWYFRRGNAYKVWFGDLRGSCLRYDGQTSFHEMLGLHDRRTFNLLSKLMAESGLVTSKTIIADVGANVGIYSLWFSRLLASAEGAKIYAFEPNPAAVDILVDNLKMNRMENVEVVPLGLADQVGTADFFVTTEHKTASLVADQQNGSGKPVRKIQVGLTTFDQFFVAEGRGIPDFIKLDIEGAATFALKACRRCLERKLPLILVESHNIDEDKSISQLMSEFGYSAFRINNLAWVKDPDKTYPQPDGIWGNMFLIPPHLHSKLAAVLR